MQPRAYALSPTSSRRTTISSSKRENLRFVAHVPDQVNLKLEFEIEDEGSELEIELTW